MYPGSWCSSSISSSLERLFCSWDWILFSEGRYPGMFKRSSSVPGAGSSSQEGDSQVCFSGPVLVLGLDPLQEGYIQVCSSGPVCFLGLDPFLRGEISRYAPVVQFWSWGWTLFSGGKYPGMLQWSSSLPRPEVDIQVNFSGPVRYLGLDTLLNSEVSRWVYVV